MEFEKYKLRDIADVMISGVDKKIHEDEIPVKLCNFVDVYKNWAITSSLKESFMRATAKQIEIDRFLLHKGQVAITKDSETRNDIGIATYIADDFDDVILGYHCALITPNKELVDSKYLNAFLHSNYILRYFELHATGSGMRYTLSNDTILNMPILLPSMEQQKAIGKMFSNIDKQIETLNALNRNLEQVARQLYDYWFVQFDFPNEDGKPYKSSGGEMQLNSRLKRSIPATWHCVSLIDIANFTNGLACQKFRPTNNNEKLPVIKIREMRDGFTADSEWVTSKIPDNVKIYNGDVLFSWSASLEVMIWANGNGGLNQHIFKVTSKKGYPKSFYYFALLDYVGVFKAIADARKTTMGHITREHLEQSTIAVPTDLQVLIAFENKVSPILNSIIRNKEKSLQLKKMRDELLPMLLNGQVNCDLSQ